MPTLRETDDKIRLFEIKFHFVAVLCDSRNKTGEMGSQSHLRRSMWPSFYHYKLAVTLNQLRNTFLMIFCLGFLFLFGRCF